MDLQEFIVWIELAALGNMAGRVAGYLVFQNALHQPFCLIVHKLVVLFSLGHVIHLRDRSLAPSLHTFIPISIRLFTIVYDFGRWCNVNQTLLLAHTLQIGVVMNKAVHFSRTVINVLEERITINSFDCLFFRFLAGDCP